MFFNIRRSIHQWWCLSRNGKNELNLSTSFTQGNQRDVFEFISKSISSSSWWIFAHSFKYQIVCLNDRADFVNFECKRV